MPDTLSSDQPHAARRHWMAVLARAEPDAIADGCADRRPDS
jgi:alpha-D-ribose 1-methylphosphonate 5-triphosphate synthase subunit PhnG